MCCIYVLFFRVWKFCGLFSAREILVLYFSTCGIFVLYFLRVDFFCGWNFPACGMFVLYFFGCGIYVLYISLCGIVFHVWNLRVIFFCVWNFCVIYFPRAEFSYCIYFSACGIVFREWNFCVVCFHVWNLHIIFFVLYFTAGGIFVLCFLCCISRVISGVILISSCIVLTLIFPIFPFVLYYTYLVFL